MSAEVTESQPYRLILRRAIAFFIDYIIIILPYIAILTAYSVISAGDDLSSLFPSNAVQGQLGGFVTLTLPVTLYFIVLESRRGATLGKSRMGLCVQTPDGEPAGIASITLRNVLKFIPWEIAHTIMWQYSYNEVFPEWGSIVGLVLVYGLLGIYAVTMFVTPLRQTLYDKVTGLCVMPCQR